MVKNAKHDANCVLDQDAAEASCSVETPVPESRLDDIERLTKELNQRDQFVRSQLRFREQLLETLPVGVFYRNLDGIYQGCNQVFARIMGKDKVEEVVGHHYRDVAQLAIAKQIEEQDRDLELGRVSEVEQPTPTGETFIVRRAVFTDAAGHPEGIVGAVVEVTEMKKLQQQIESGLRDWVSTFDAMNDGICLLDTTCAVTRCNRAFLRFLKAENFNDVIGKPCPALIHGDSVPPDCAGMRSMNSKTREVEEVRVNGTWFIVTVDPVITADGSVTGFVHTMRDISKRRKFMEELEKSHARYKGIVDAIQELVLRWRPSDGHICLSNATADRTFGKDIEGQNFYQLLSEKSADKLREKLATATTMSPVLRVTHNLRIVGEPRCFQFIHTVLFTEKGNLLEVQSVGRDTTEWVDDIEC